MNGGAALAQPGTGDQRVPKLELGHEGENGGLQMADGTEKAGDSGGKGAKHDPAGMADWERGLLRGMRIGHYRERTWETYRHFGAAVREVCGWAGQAGRGGG